MLPFFRLGITERVHTLIARHCAAFSRPETTDRWLDRLVAEADEFTSTIGRLDRPRFNLLLAAAALTVLYWLCYFSVAPLLLVAFDRPFAPVKVIALQTVFFFLLSAIPIPGGSGLAELGFAQLFAHLLPAALVGVFVSLWRLVTYDLSVVAGALVFLDILRQPQTGPAPGGSSSV